VINYDTYAVARFNDVPVPGSRPNLPATVQAWDKNGLTDVKTFNVPVHLVRMITLPTNVPIVIFTPESGQTFTDTYYDVADDAKDNPENLHNRFQPNVPAKVIASDGDSDLIELKVTIRVYVKDCDGICNLVNELKSKVGEGTHVVSDGKKHDTLEYSFNLYHVIPNTNNKFEYEVEVTATARDAQGHETTKTANYTVVTKTVLWSPPTVVTPTVTTPIVTTPTVTTPPLCSATVNVLTHFDKCVDTTQVSTITVLYEATATGQNCYLTKVRAYLDDDKVYEKNVNAKSYSGTVTIDVSKLSGTHVVKVEATTNTGFTATDTVTFEICSDMCQIDVTIDTPGMQSTPSGPTPWPPGYLPIRFTIHTSGNCGNVIIHAQADIYKMTSNVKESTIMSDTTNLGRITSYSDTYKLFLPPLAKVRFQIVAETDAGTTATDSRDYYTSSIPDFEAYYKPTEYTDPLGSAIERANIYAKINDKYYYIGYIERGSQGGTTVYFFRSETSATPASPDTAYPFGKISTNWFVDWGYFYDVNNQFKPLQGYVNQYAMRDLVCYYTGRW